jgi:hypothetical protein
MVAMSGTLPMFLMGAEPSEASASIPLFEYGITTGTSGSFNSVQLYLDSDPMTTNMPLHISGYEPGGSPNSDINLYMYGFVNSNNSNISLFMPGATGNGVLNENNLTLFMEGKGQEYSSNINLFLANNSAGDSVSLYMNGDEPNYDSVDLYIYGVSGSPSDSVNLHMQAYGKENSSTTLFIRGYNNGVVNNNPTSAILSLMSLDDLSSISIINLASSSL